MATVSHPKVTVKFNGKDATKDISPYLTELTYTDHTHGKSDELEITFEDRNHKFKNEWFVLLGMPISVTIGYAEGSTLNCGTFELEEVEFGSPPDTVRLKAVGTVISPKLRTKKHRGFEKNTLAGIVKVIAKDNGLTVKGDIENIEIDRSTQNHEKDLEYLRRLAKDYGYAFAVKGNILSFYKMENLENTPSGLSLKRTEIEEFNLTFKAIGTYTEANVVHHRAKAKKKVGAKVKAAELGTASGVKTSDGKPLADLSGGTTDTLEVISRSQSEGVAKIKARAKLHEKNREQATGDITIKGNTKMVAGLTIDLAGIGRLGGPYFIDTATHTVTRSDGYKTKLELKRPTNPAKASKKR